MALLHDAPLRNAPATDDRLRDLLELHFHPEWGSSYWLRRQERLGWNVRDRVRTLDDLLLLGSMPLADLRSFPVRDFIPRGLHGQLQRFIVGETAGTSGEPCATAYRDDEFQAAFIAPFLRVAKALKFPHGKPWLWVGPSGPHIIGKVVRELARQTGSMDPFSVDFDPRWAKRLADGSTARQRYLDHVTTQALDVLRREEVGVLFITPPALAALAARLSDSRRDSIQGIHYGGMSLTPEMVNDFRAAFPRAVHLAGYGNTLFGVVMEMADAHRLAMDYFPLDDRVRFHVVDWPDDGKGAESWPPSRREVGQIGRVLFHRLDESCLLVGMLERDQAERIPPSPEAIALGGHADGLRNPQPPAALVRGLQMGLY
jgi:thienamycin biosynthesis protein ThnN